MIDVPITLGVVRVCDAREVDHCVNRFRQRLLVARPREVKLKDADTRVSDAYLTLMASAPNFCVLNRLEQTLQDATSGD
jgi:hypothetical protein